MATPSTNIFINQEIYPNVTEIFQIHSKSLEEISHSAVIVLDTNVLLLPFKIESQNLEDILSLFKRFKTESRINIPGQVAREFAKNRPEKLKDLYQSLTLAESQASKFTLPKYPIISDIDVYRNLLEMQVDLNQKVAAYRNEIGKLKRVVSEWAWDDPVSKGYREIFSPDVIVELPINKQKIEDELDNRIRYSIPPGYKDSAKPDKGIGDFLIWLTILEIAKGGKDIIFVSGDEKNDWFHQSAKTPLYSRFELISEFKRETNGREFHMIRLSDLLKLFNANERVVQEVELNEKIGGEAQIESLTEFNLASVVRYLAFNQGFHSSVRSFDFSYNYFLALDSDGEVNIYIVTLDEITFHEFTIMIRDIVNHHNISLRRSKLFIFGADEQDWELTIRYLKEAKFVNPELLEILLCYRGDAYRPRIYLSFPTFTDFSEY